MTNNTTPTGRLVMTLVAVIAGILLLLVVPSLGGQAMRAILSASLASISETGAAAPKLITFFFPFWMSLCSLSGAVLLLLARPIYRGDHWARPLALAMLSIPSITGAYIFGPVMYFARPLVPNVIIILLTGLAPYFIILLCERSSLPNKAINFTTFLLLGILTAASFTNGHSSLRMLLDRSDSTLFTAEYYGYALGIPAVWIGVVLIMAGIPLLAGRSHLGWWLASIGTVGILLGTLNFYLHHYSAWFIGGIVIALASLIMLVVPRLGGSLIDYRNDAPQAIPALNSTLHTR